MKKQIIKLLKIVEKARKVTEVPTEREVEAWINKNEFEPWM